MQKYLAKNLRFVFAVLLGVFCLVEKGDLLAQPQASSELELWVPPNLLDARREITTSRTMLSGEFRNLSASDKEAILISNYESDSKNQFGRKAWIPANSRISYFYSMGPVDQVDREKQTIDIQSILYDVTDGTRKVIKSKDGRAFFTSKLRMTERGTRMALIGDSSFQLKPRAPRYLRNNAPLSDLEIFLQLVRVVQIKPVHYEIIKTALLPATEDAYQGLDYLVLAGDQIVYDAAGCRALRNWIENDGGRLWIMADRVSESTVTSLLGETVLYDVVERTQLNDIQFVPGPGNDELETEESHHHEKTVEFVKVMTNPENVLHNINGWPASIIKDVGKGTILVTTLGTNGWTRNLKKDEGHPYRKFSHLPVPAGALKKLIFEWSPQSKENEFEVAKFQKTLEEKIGHSIISRSKVISILGIFCGSLFVIGLILKLLKKSSYFGLVGPIISIGISGFFFNYGLNATQKTPPTIATYQFANVVEETNDIAMEGLISVYYPNNYNEIIGIDQGGRFQFEKMTETDGTTIIQTDLDSWVFEDLEMRRGVQTTKFEQVQALSQPLVAKVTFDSAGLKGTIDTDLFNQFEDALILTPQKRLLRVEIAPDGQFQSTPGDILEENVYVKAKAGSLVLDTDQQRHASIYSEYLNQSPPNAKSDELKTVFPKALRGKNYFLTWASPIDTSFMLQEGAQVVGASLIAIPLDFQKPQSDTEVAIPATLIPYRSVVDQAQGQRRSSAYSNRTNEWNSVSTATNSRLRFQLPPAVLPMELNRVRLTVKITAPSRELTIEGIQGSQKKVLYTVDSPIGIKTFDIDQKDVLTLDDQGGLLLEINVGDTTDVDNTGNKLNWLIDFVELEAYGITK